MKPKKDSWTSEMDVSTADSQHVVQQLVLLIVEARTPDQSAKGRVEGPHCVLAGGGAGPGALGGRGASAGAKGGGRGEVPAYEAHRCAVEKQECVRAAQFCESATRLWTNGIPVCVDILLFPACTHGKQEVGVMEGTGSIHGTRENALLVERWTVEMERKRPPKQTQLLHPSLLLQAVRSYLHFSQISSWLYSTGGRLPGLLLVYRICAPYEESTSDYHDLSDSHAFPVCITNREQLRVRVNALTRRSTVPSLMCVDYDHSSAAEMAAASMRTSKMSVDNTTTTTNTTRMVGDDYDGDACRDNIHGLGGKTVGMTRGENIKKYRTSVGRLDNGTDWQSRRRKEARGKCWNDWQGVVVGGDVEGDGGEEGTERREDGGERFIGMERKEKKSRGLKEGRRFDRKQEVLRLEDGRMGDWLVEDFGDDVIQGFVVEQPGRGRDRRKSKKMVDRSKVKWEFEYGDVEFESRMNGGDKELPGRKGKTFDSCGYRGGWLEFGEEEDLVGDVCVVEDGLCYQVWSPGDRRQERGDWDLGGVKHVSRWEEFESAKRRKEAMMMGGGGGELKATRRSGVEEVVRSIVDREYGGGISEVEDQRRRRRKEKRKKDGEKDLRIEQMKLGMTLIRRRRSEDDDEEEVDEKGDDENSKEEVTVIGNSRTGRERNLKTLQMSSSSPDKYCVNDLFDVVKTDTGEEEVEQDAGSIVQQQLYPSCPSSPLSVDVSFSELDMDADSDATPIASPNSNSNTLTRSSGTESLFKLMTERKMMMISNNHHHHNNNHRDLGDGWSGGPIGDETTTTDMECVRDIARLDDTTSHKSQPSSISSVSHKFVWNPEHGFVEESSAESKSCLVPSSSSSSSLESFDQREANIISNRLQSGSNANSNDLNFRDTLVRRTDELESTDSTKASTISRKMFQENLLPLASYDAKTDSFKKVEDAATRGGGGGDGGGGNILHSPKVLFSCDIPEDYNNTSCDSDGEAGGRKYIDFEKVLSDSQFFKTKLQDVFGSRGGMLGGLGQTVSGPGGDENGVKTLEKKETNSWVEVKGNVYCADKGEGSRNPLQDEMDVPGMRVRIDACLGREGDGAVIQTRPDKTLKEEQRLLQQQRPQKTSTPTTTSIVNRQLFTDGQASISPCPPSHDWPTSKKDSVTNSSTSSSSSSSSYYVALSSASTSSPSTQNENGQTPSLSSSLSSERLQSNSLISSSSTSAEKSLSCTYFPSPDPSTTKFPQHSKSHTLPSSPHTSPSPPLTPQSITPHTLPNSIDERTRSNHTEVWIPVNSVDGCPLIKNSHDIISQTNGIVHSHSTDSAFKQEQIRVKYDKDVLDIGDHQCGRPGNDDVVNGCDRVGGEVVSDQSVKGVQEGDMRRTGANDAWTVLPNGNSSVDESNVCRYDEDSKVLPSISGGEDQARFINGQTRRIISDVSEKSSLLSQRLDLPSLPVSESLPVSNESRIDGSKKTIASTTPDFTGSVCVLPSSSSSPLSLQRPSQSQSNIGEFVSSPSQHEQQEESRCFNSIQHFITQNGAFNNHHLKDCRCVDGKPCQEETFINSCTGTQLVQCCLVKDIHDTTNEERVGGRKCDSPRKNENGSVRDEFSSTTGSSEMVLLGKAKNGKDSSSGVDSCYSQDKDNENNDNNDNGYCDNDNKNKEVECLNGQKAKSLEKNEEEEEVFFYLEDDVDSADFGERIGNGFRTEVTVDEWNCGNTHGQSYRNIDVDDRKLGSFYGSNQVYTGKLDDVEPDSKIYETRLVKTDETSASSISSSVSSSLSSLSSYTSSYDELATTKTTVRSSSPPQSRRLSSSTNKLLSSLLSSSSSVAITATAAPMVLSSSSSTTTTTTIIPSVVAVTAADLDDSTTPAATKTTSTRKFSIPSTITTTNTTTSLSTADDLNLQMISGPMADLDLDPAGKVTPKRSRLSSFGDMSEGWDPTPPSRSVSSPNCMEGEVRGRGHHRSNSHRSPLLQQSMHNLAKEGREHRSSAISGTSMVFNSRTSLPTQSSPAPLKRNPGGRFDYDSTLVSVKAIKNAFSCSKLALGDKHNSKDDNDLDLENSKRTLSTSAPASTNCLLGNFEESILNGRIDPVGTVSGFTAEIGASGSFCPKHTHLPVSAFFFDLSDDNAPSPYLGHINLRSIGSKKGYHIPKKGTVQVTLFNPNKTVVKMFVVMYDLSDMPLSSQTFIRQRTMYVPCDRNSTAPSYLRYLIHLRCASTRSGKIYLHTDIRLIFARHKLDMDAKTVPYQMKSFTELPKNPKYSPKK